MNLAGSYLDSILQLKNISTFISAPNTTTSGGDGSGDYSGGIGDGGVVDDGGVGGIVTALQMYAFAASCYKVGRILGVWLKIPNLTHLPANQLTSTRIRHARECDQLCAVVEFVADGGVVDDSVQ
jgi:hypothetical protein